MWSGRMCLGAVGRSWCGAVWSGGAGYGMVGFGVAVKEGFGRVWFGAAWLCGHVMMRYGTIGGAECGLAVSSRLDVVRRG